MSWFRLLPGWGRSRRASAASSFTGDSEEVERKVMRCISKGQRSLARLRWRCGLAMLSSGLVFSILFEIGMRADRRDVRAKCDQDVTDHLLSVFNHVCFDWRLICWSLAPLAGDIYVTRFVLLLEALVVSLIMPLFTPVVADVMRKNWFEHHLASLCIFLIGVIVAMYVVCTISLMFMQDAARMKRYMWLTMGWRIMAIIPLKIIVITELIFECRSIPRELWHLPILIFCVWICRNHELRDNWHARLNATFETRSSYRGAASIAGLVGDCPAKEVLAQAKERFRAVEIDALALEHFQSNCPDPGLHALRIPLQFQDCDAFLSHSWHDDPQCKWDALQRWRQTFCEEHGREPKVWFDKVCIDQNDIETDLRCLPIYLSGCRKLVVLCGPTYLSRLWCIVELFTYVHIGRSVCDIDFVDVSAGGEDGTVRESSCSGGSFEECILNFDANLCMCANSTDKERMMIIIKAAYGSIDAFNEAIRKTFGHAHWSGCPRSVSRRITVDTVYRDDPELGLMIPTSSEKSDGMVSDNSEDAASTSSCVSPKRGAAATSRC